MRIRYTSSLVIIGDTKHEKGNTAQSELSLENLRSYAIYFKTELFTRTNTYIKLATTESNGNDEM